MTFFNKKISFNTASIVTSLEFLLVLALLVFIVIYAQVIWQRYQVSLQTNTELSSDAIADNGSNNNSANISIKDKQIMLEKIHQNEATTSNVSVADKASILEKIQTIDTTSNNGETQTTVADKAKLLQQFAD